jgi:glycosyltransferase involved in cell wall biosynthesis
MKILQLCNKAPYPANDGSSIAICSLAEGLADNGVELHLMPVNTKKHFKPEENIPAAFKAKTHYRSVFKNTDTSPMGALFNLFSPHYYFVSRFFFSEYKEHLIKTLKQNSFDIVLIDGVFMASYIPVIRQHSNAKIVLRTHNVEHQIWERHLAIEKNSLKKAYLTLQNKRLKSYEVAAFNQVDAIATITDEDKKNIALIVPGKPIVTCLTGIDLERYQFVSPVSKPNTVFHFASMDWMPNVEAVDWLMNEVWSLVEKKLPGTTLVLAGRGMPERFRNMAGSNIKVITDVESSADFYATYDLMLVPLWSGSGLRIKLVEGFAYGKAVITTSIGAEGIPYRHGHDVMIADSAHDFAEAIVAVLSDSAYKQRLEHNARALAEAYFNYKTIAAGLLHFCKTL